MSLTETVQGKFIASQVSSDEIRQDGVLKREPARRSWADFEMLSMNLGIASDELHKIIDEDPEHFKKVFSFIGQQEYHITWVEAERILADQHLRQQKLLDDISRYHNSGKPRGHQHPTEPKIVYPHQEPGPPKIYEDHPNKRRSQKGRRQRLAEKAKYYMAVNMINNENLDRHD